MKQLEKAFGFTKSQTLTKTMSHFMQPTKLWPVADISVINAIFISLFPKKDAIVLS